MRVVRSGVAAFVLLAVLTASGRAKAQAVGFAPTVGSAPDGVSLGATPSVSADRRYVRLGVSPRFQTVNGFSTFPVPAAVGGGGFRSMMGPGVIDPFDFGMGSPDYGVPYARIGPTKASAKAAKVKAARAKKPLPDPVVLPIKKKAEPRG